MASLECLLCGEVYDSRFNEKLWQESCPICCGLSLCKVLEISTDEWRKMLSIVDHGYDMPDFGKGTTYYSLKDNVCENELVNNLSLLCMISDKIILDGSNRLRYFPRNIMNTVNNLINKGIVIPIETHPGFEGISNFPESYYEDIPWKNEVYYPFSKTNVKPMDIYLSLYNMSLAITTSEIERVIKWSEHQPPGTLGYILDKLGYVSLPQTLWLEFIMANYFILSAAKGNSKMILNENRAHLFSLKYGIRTTQQKNIDSLKYLMKKRRLRLPNFSADAVIKMRNSSQVENLRNILNGINSLRDSDLISNANDLINEFDSATRSYNDSIKKYGTISSAFITGTLATVGGLIGGPLGAVVGGIGATAASYGVDYIIEKHYASEETYWPFIFIQGK